MSRKRKTETELVGRGKGLQALVQHLDVLQEDKEGLYEVQESPSKKFQAANMLSIKGAQTEIQQERGSKYTEVVQQKQNTSATVPSKVNIIQPMLTNPVITPSNPAHNGRVCSTWGNFHFKTFDGDIFSFPGLCNYVFASHCNTPYEDFNIQIRRIVVENAPTVNRITMKLEGVAAELTKDVVVINGNRVQLPYSQSGITIAKSSIYVKVASKMGIVLMWNEDDSILLELNEKYANQTCGLCGDFNGFPIYNEFYSNNIKMTALQFGNMQKMDGPTEHCEDSLPTLPHNCTDNFDDICQKTLTSSAFEECNDLVDVREYIMACQDDLCLSEESKNASCICDTFAEYSRQCAHAGGHPWNWRTSKLCPKKCPYNMQYQECSSPCADTCTNPERSQFCEEHCMDGCFCPPGTVFDDINNSGCIPHQQCSCVYNGNTYATGTSFSEQWQTCTCNGGRWSCQDTSYPGTCSVEGGSHITTYDKKYYDHHGDCTYVLSKHCKDETFTILVELRKCGLTDTETCLKTVTLNMNKGQTLIEVKPDGGVFVNSIYTQLPISAANVTVFRPSTFFIIMQTKFGVHLEIQITPIMQVFVRLDPIFKDQTCGLCGNFNDNQMDDFKAISGIIEGTATAFANTWKTQALCPNIQHSFENPCALSIDNEKYAQHWCGLLSDSKGPFADCHYAVNPSVYHTNCMFDTCNCENSEDCLCAALSSYVRACAAKGIQLRGWRTDVCSKYTTSCPKSLSYSYTISSCQPTCRSLSEPDVTCNIKFVPVDGCTCVNGTYMDESGKCVPANECPCYYRGSPIAFGEVVHENGLVCTCIQGRLNCIGEPKPTPVCESPMVYFDCRNITAGTTGAECQKSCKTLDMECYSTQCVPGCMCPAGLVLDENGGCISDEKCPCIHNEAIYQPGEKINVDCNTCVCKNRKWECTEDQCLGTCAVYGDGHYNTFDDKRFSFNGNCEYTLVQDHCGKSGTANGTFRVITENIPCGNTGTTCSKSIKVFLESYELILLEEHVSVIKRGQNHEVPYTFRYMGIYLVIETTSGLILMWDKKTSIFIKLSPDFKGQICGLCGNYDGNGINDFTTRSQSVVENVLEFGNSWKVSSTCPDAYSVKDPCSTNPYRKSWSEKQCSIINSNVFATCHSQVEPAKYYQACVTDACACDTGGDCDCFCTAVAAYAQACSEVGVCVAWRTPSICPLFCDYYNQQGECEWHYKPCGASCMKTCRNPSGKCLHNLPGLEGCYPNCPPDKPYFHEDQMKCVSLCDCYDNEDGKIYRRDECRLCECTSEGLQCKFDDKEVTTATPVTTVCVKNVCAWSEWYDSTQPENKEDSGDYETFENLRGKGYSVCKNPNGVQCRAKEHPDTEINNLNQTVHCSQSKGLICNNTDQQSKHCYNYEIRISCCSYIPCSEISTITPTTTEELTTTAVKSTPFTLQTKIKPTTNTKETEAQKTKIPTVSPKTTESTTPLTSVTAQTSQVSTASYQTTSAPGEIITVATQPTASSTTASTVPEPKIKTTTATTVVPSTTAPPTQGTTIITTTSNASTSRTTERSTTTSTATSAPAETSTVATQPPTSPTTASTVPEPKIKTTIGTTVVPSTTVPSTEGTTIITTTSSASTTNTSLPLTEGTTTITTPTVPTSAGSSASTSRTTERSTTTSTAITAPPTQGTTIITTTSSASTSRTTERSTTTTTATSAPAETSTAAPQPPTSPTTASNVPEPKIKTTTGTTVVPSTTAPPTQATTIITTTSRASTSSTTERSTTTSTATSAPAETSTVATQPPTSPTTASTVPEPKIKTTIGTTVVPSTTAPPTEGTTVITTTRRASTTNTSPPLTEGTTTITTATPTVPTSAASSASTSRTTERSTTTSTATSAPAETSTVATQPPTSPTTASSVPEPKIKTTTATTVVPNTTAPLTQGTTTTTTPTPTVPTSAASSASSAFRTIERSTTTSTATTAPPTQGTTTSTTPTPTVPTSAASSASSAFRTTERSTTTTTATSAPAETSTAAPQPPTSPTTASTVPEPKIKTTTGTTVVPSTTAPPTQATTIITTTSRASTTNTSPPLTQGTTTITTPTVPTSAASSASTSRTTERSTTTSTATSAPAETSTVATQPPTSPMTASTVPEPKIKTTIATTVVPSTTAPPTQGTTTITTPTPTVPTTSRASTTNTSPPLTEGTTTITTPASTVPTSAAITTVSTSETTKSCQQRCTWTQWFDLDSPSPGSENGDIETFAKIRAAGYALCDKPQDIKCRAKDYPDRSLDKLGQTFECSVDTGLVCRNKDQITKYPICFNYEVRVLCCDRKHCQTTSAPPGTTAGSSTSVFPAETSTVATQTPAPLTTTSTLPKTAMTTTTGTTVVPSTTAPPTEGTTVITTTSRASTTNTSPPLTEGTTTITTPTPTVPTSAASSASTSRTTERSTTTSTATSAPAETSTVATQPPTSLTTASSVPEPKIKTTTATTVVPSTTAPPTQGTTIITTISSASTSSTTERSTTTTTATSAPAETSTAAPQPPTSPTTASTVPEPKIKTTTGTTVVPSTTAPPTQATTIITTTSRASTTNTSPPLTQGTTTITTPTVPTSAASSASTSRTTERSTTTSTATSAPAETSTAAPQPPTSPTTASNVPEPKIKTTTGTTVVPSTTAPPTQATTIITTTSRASTSNTSPSLTEGTTSITTPTVPTSAASSASTSKTTERSTTTSTATSAPAETSTVATQPPTSPTTASTVPEPKIKTTTGTTVVPSTTAPPTEGTTVITTTRRASTTNTSPPLTEGTTTITTATPTVPTSAASSASTSRTTERSTTTSTATSAPAETSTVATQPPTSPTTASSVPEPKIKTTTATTVVPNTTAPLTQGTTTTTTPTPTVPTSAASSASSAFRTIERSTTTSTATTAPPTQGTTIITTTSSASTSRTTERSTTTTTATSAPAETSTAAPQPPTSPTTASTVPEPKIKTTTGTTVVPSTTAPPTQATTIITTTSRASTTNTSPPLTQGTTTITTPTVPTSAASSASTSRTTERSTTTSTATSAPAETSTVATQPPTSPTTASTVPEPKIKTTIATTVVPSTTAPPTQGTTTITTPTPTVPTTSRASTTNTSPPLTEGTTTITTPASTVPTSAAITTVSTSETTKSCQQRCTWTQWFDLDSPSPGSENGDIETFAKIRAAGYALCDKPQDIKCRAKDYPDRSLDKLGQTFECSVDTGLVCRNKDQITKYPICFNYEVRVLCCDRKHCQTTSAPPGTTAGSSTTVFPAETSTVATQTPAPLTTTSTLPKTAMTTTTGTTVVPSTTAPPTEGTTVITTTSRASTTNTSPPLTEGTTTITTPTPTVPTSAASSASTSRTTERSTTTSTATSAPAETSTAATQPPTSPTTASNVPEPKIKTTTGTTVVPSTTAPPRQGTTIITTISSASTSSTTERSTTTSTVMSAPAETSTVATQPPTSPTTASTVPEPKIKTTIATTVVPSTTAPPTQATTIITTTSSASTSRITERSTTTSAPTYSPAETSTAAPQPPTSPATASTPPPSRITSTIGGTAILRTSVSSTGPSPATTFFPTTFTTTSSPVATSGTSQSSHVTTSTSTIFSSSPSTPVTTEASTYVTSSATAPCFCHVFGNFFSPGEVVYNRTDRAGCNFYALCSKECEIEPFQGPCPSTTPFTSAASETTTQAASSTERVFPSVSPTTATSLTTPVERNCTDVSPPRKPGENWTSECQQCVCDLITSTVQCERLPCQTVQTPICDLGFVTVPVLPPKDPCCPEYECQPLPDICVINGTIYPVGMSIVINSCKKCTCSSEKDPVTKANIVHCETVQCETSCPLGHQYMTEDGECCGKCIEVACKVKLSNNTVQVLKVNEILPLDHCSHYKCEKIEDQFVAVQTKKICPEYDPGECDPDEAETTPDGCCKICKPTNCKPYTKKTVIRQGDCESSEPVELRYCEGTCPGSSVYSLEANQMQHECSCCQEYSSQTREVTLTCQNGTSINYNYVYVEQCQCMNACTSKTSTAHSSQLKQSAAYASQWKTSRR
ncbi:mucin-2 [Gavia stellata]|uniref:mucin-2 n=1 Tax=Gavia stellata TaxID=37040 RepID=UPI0028963455|nr:mucin-2 [Gavia stellata]